MRSWLLIPLVALLCLPAAAQTQDAPPSGQPLVLVVPLEDEAITPPLARFLDRAIRQAAEQRAACLVLQLDTPGGLVDSTRHIVKSILAADVPIVVYVAPAGARAASAGVFITQAAHVAAMAPGTNIGAAHPVRIGGLPGPAPAEPKGTDQNGKTTDPLQDKILNDTVAWARALAELRGRNVDWVTRAVKDSISAPASEAVQEHAVDLLADDLDDLLAEIDGREVRLPSGTVRLRTAGAEIRTVERWWGERLLGVLADPNLAFLLVLFGFYGILFELYTPGWGVAGTLGVLCLVLGFFALAVLPIDYVGLALLVLALALFLAEPFVVSYGFLTLGGAVCLVLGGLMLVESPAGFQAISLWLLVPVALATAAIAFFLVGNIVKTHRGRTRTGTEGLVGNEALALEDFAPAGNRFIGMVRTHGELWRADSPRPIASGQTLVVRARRGLTLDVLPAEHPSNPTPPHA